MNYFREAQTVLSNRKKLESSLKNLSCRKNRLIDSGVPQGLTGLDPAKPYVSGGAVNDTMADCLDLIQINKEVAITKAKIKEIDDVIGQLSKDKKDLLNLWYIDYKTKDEICESLHYASRKSLYDHRNRAIGEFAILYFGASGLNAT